MMSRATRDRFARAVGAPEAFDDLADFLLVGIRRILLLVLCISGDVSRTALPSGGKTVHTVSIPKQKLWSQSAKRSIASLG